MRPRSLLAALAAFALCALSALPAPLRAQVGATTDIITGKVTGPSGQPVSNAIVAVVSIETQVTRTRTTNERGQFTVLFPDGGGQYRVTVRALGFSPATITVQRNADEDRLQADIRLSQAPPTTLSTVTIRATPRPQTGADRPTPGTSERVVTGDQLNRLPIDGSDPNAVAGLSSSVVTTSATDSTAAGFSVAGQRPDQNQITLDGLTFGGAAVPQEAVRATRVVTNTYDVSRGQFTGGQVATTTRSGTNIVQGSFGYDLRDPDLQFTDDQSTAFGQRYTQHQLSGGLGGPIAKDKLFAFGSFQYRHRAQGLQSLLNANGDVLNRLGASEANVDRFLNLLETSGVPAAEAGAPDQSLSDNLSLLTRVDWNLAERHTLALRGDWRWGQQGGTRISPLGVPQSGGDLSSLGGGAMLTLTSQWDAGIINELRAYGSLDNRSTDPYQRIPMGRVRVESILEDGSSALTNLTFGGSPGLPQATDNTQLETTDEVSWISRGGGHRVKLGSLLNVSGYDQTSNANQWGVFGFESLDAFAAGQPSSFSRTFGATERKGASVNGALYLGDTWRVTRALQMVYGARLEGTRYTGTPAYNPAVDTAFGRRTDDFPSEVHASPRAGFTWTFGLPAQGQQGQGGRPGQEPGVRGAPARVERQAARQAQGPFSFAPALILRGGFGEFRGRVPSGLFTSAVGATGLPGGETQIQCFGDNVPTVDWAAWVSDPATIPTTCADGGSGGLPGAPRRSNVTTFDPDFGAPRSWRYSLGAQRRLVGRYFLNVEGVFSRGTHLYGVSDMNLDATPDFTLATEGNRPVYVPAASIIDTTGATNSFLSRKDPRFNSVFDVASTLRSNTGQFTVGINGFTGRGLAVSASYTGMRSRDQSSFSCCSAGQAFGAPTTAANPNETPWSRSDLERRHVIVTTATFPAHPSVEITGVLRVMSGQPYTPRVANDINGDGVRNDRAFIFDPASAPDTALANGMQRLLAGASGGVKDCLRAQMGGIAARNSCTGAWYPSVDLRVNYRPDQLGLKRNLMLSFLFVNPLAGLDQLLHGQDGMHGWGQPARIDPNLLYVTGFDRTSNRFLYRVNERFGAASSANRNAFRSPFQLAFQARYTVGPDRGRQMMLAAQAAARGQTGGDSAGRGGPGGGLARLAPNPFAQILQLKDSLALTPEQVAQLEPLRDTMAVRNAALVADVQKRMQGIGNNADPQAMMAQLREPLEKGRQNFAEAIAAAEKILTPAQWAKVPERVKTPQMGGGQRRGGPGGEGRGGPPF